jgi:hypothetical protein
MPIQTRTSHQPKWGEKGAQVLSDAARRSQLQKAPTSGCAGLLSGWSKLLRRHDLSQRAEHGSQALLHRSRPDGERHGLIVDTRLTRVSGHAERLAALEMIEPRADKPEAITLGGDKGFDAANFVMELREINVTPHIGQNLSRRSAIDGRTTRHSGYAVSQRIRKRIEEGFGWMKTIAGLKKTKYHRLERIGWSFTMAAAAFNLIRLSKLMGGV